VSIRGLSLDLGKMNTGIVAWADNHVLWIDDVTFKNTSTLGETLKEFKELVLLQTPPAATHWIAYEQRMTAGPRMGLRHLELHYGMVGILHMRAWTLQVPILSIPISTAKKTLTGNGRADKDAMVTAAKSRFPRFVISSHDIADAIAVGLAALDRIEFDHAQPAPF
jgi:Holliday junction resolvasome RuvABC endonuclease subunit